MDADFLKSAIDYIFSKGKESSQVVEVEGCSFAPAHLNLKQIHEDAVPPIAPQVPTFKVQTLTGLVGLIKNGLQGMSNDDEDYFVHIVDQVNVQLVARSSDRWGRRLILADCRAFAYDAFPFEDQQEQTDFLIEFQSKFVQDDSAESDYNYVLRIASNLTASGVTMSDDSGIQQEVVVRTSISGRSEVALRPLVTLAPWRTFTEVTQPASKFLFRMWPQGSQEKPSLPLLSLHEADGASWKKEAMDSIKTFMEQSVEIPVIC